MLARHIALMVMVQFIWGSNFSIAKFGLDSFSPIFFVALRFSIVAVLLVFIVGLPKRAMLPRLLPLSVTMGVMHFTLEVTKSLETLTMTNCRGGNPPPFPLPNPSGPAALPDMPAVVGTSQSQDLSIPALGLSSKMTVTIIQTK